MIQIPGLPGALLLSVTRPLLSGPAVVSPPVLRSQYSYVVFSPFQGSPHRLELWGPQVDINYILTGLSHLERMACQTVESQPSLVSNSCIISWLLSCSRV